jgi:hypothetical protein
MLDVSATHPFEACAAFAVRFLRHLADGDLAAAEALIDVNDNGRPFAESFLAPVPGPGGFSYAHPDRMPSWTMYVLRADERGLGLDFEVPFAEAEYAGRSLSARFELRRVGGMLEVRMTGAVPN